jgi:putative transposase
MCSWSEILQAEITEYLGVELRERTEDRPGYRSGSYEQNLTIRIRSLKLEVPCDKIVTCQMELFERYQRSEKALVTTLMQMVLRGVSTLRSAIALMVVGISEDGSRKILGFKIALRETGESWREPLGELKRRDLSGVELATRDAHESLDSARRETFPECI